MGEPTFEVHDSEHGLESVGPFHEWRIKCDGYGVPKLTGRADGKGMFHLSLDHRFGIEVPEQYAHQVVWLIANALAIGAGYSCFGENSRIANPFKVRMSGISLTSDIEMDELTPTTN
jgi:hypothetical protein